MTRWLLSSGYTSMILCTKSACLMFTSSTAIQDGLRQVGLGGLMKCLR